MGAVCPACGVAIVPGYVKCPRCHRPLPRIAKPTSNPSGTALAPERRRFPIAPLVIAVAVAGGIVAVFSLRHTAPPSPPAAPPPPIAVATAPEPSAVAPKAAPLPDAEPAPAARPAPEAVAAQLERSLKHAHLWSTVEVIGSHADVRSGSCNDPALKSALEAAHASFRASGLTRVRCLEQSGLVVFARDL